MIKETRFILLVQFFALAIVTCAAQSTVVSIDGVYIERDSLSKKSKPQSFRANEKPVVNGDVLAFDIPGFGEFLEASHISVNDVHLLIDGIAIEEIPAYVENMESGIVRFEFVINDLTAEHRQAIYNRRGGTTKRLNLGIQAGEGMKLYASPKVEFFLKSIDFWRTIGLTMIGAFLIFFAVVIIWFPTMLKDAVPSSLENSLDEVVDQGEERTFAYSFSKSQLAFWTLIIISSFIYIWAMTDDFSPTNTTALVLLGISAGTTVASGIASNRQNNNASQNVQPLNGPPANDNEQQRSLRAFINSRLSYKNFFRDILSDSSGVSIHRVQSFVFTIIFGAVFLKSVVWDLGMPIFGDVELLLMGISNGTYALNKPSEDQ